MNVRTLPHPDRRLKLGFLSPHNPHDRRTFSGSSYFAARALEQHPDVRLRVLGGHCPPPNRLTSMLRRTPEAPQIRQSELIGLDAVVGLVATSLLCDAAAMNPRLPLIHVTDATPSFLREEYGWAVPAWRDDSERRLAQHAVATVYSSEALSARAPTDLGVAGMRPISIPFGINLDQMPGTCPRKPSLSKIRLLFVGLDWARKGGDVAVAALDLLRARGHDAELTVVGHYPEALRKHPGITTTGFLNKNRPRDAARLTQLMTEAHLLVLPTRGDCTPMVLAEAMAHGTPVIATDVGGVSSVLGGPGTGCLMVPHASPDEWATAIVTMTQDQDLYQLYSDTCFEHATMHLTWNNWSEAITSLTRQIVADEDHRGLKVAIGT